MLIDWFTVFAQLLNFAILVVALKFLLYDRIVKAMDQRRRTIAEQESSAAALAREAEEELARLRAERRELDRTREEILDEARAQAAAQQRKLLQQAREDVDRQAQEWRESLRNHQHALLSHLQRTTGEKAAEVSRRLLADLADRTLEDAILSGLRQRMAELSTEDRAAIAASVASDHAPVVVCTAFEPSLTGRHEIEQVLSELTGDADRAVRWEQDSTIISGIVVRLGAHSVGWSVADYLDGVEREFAQVLRTEVTPTEADGESE